MSAADLGRGAHRGDAARRPVAASVPHGRTFYERSLKRPLDVTAALLALVSLGPVLAVAALLIWLEDRGPAMFRQDRVGRDGEIFGCLKLRSMPVHERQDVASADGRDLEVTKVGRLVRRTHIDEIPQIFNVLRGDMSVVGPRPGLPSQVELHDARRASGAIALRPGLTGLAQLTGYDGMSETAKAEVDAAYAHRVSFRSDLAIICRTVPFLFREPPVY